MDTSPALAEPDLIAVEAGGCAPPIVVIRAAAAVACPALKAFLDERRIDYAEAARMIGGVSREGVRLWCLPFADAKRRTPREGALARIAAFTGWTLDETRAAFTPSATGEGRP